MNGRVVSINVSRKRGEKKHAVASARLVAGRGIEGDAHAGSRRQISLLAIESIESMGEGFRPGDFAENITTEGLDLLALAVGTQLAIGEKAVLRITEHGKVCHAPCAIFQEHGRCVMPGEGLFAEVVEGGEVRTGFEIRCCAGDVP